MHINKAAQGILLLLAAAKYSYSTHHLPHKSFKSAEIKFVENQDATVEWRSHADYFNQARS